MSDGVFADFPEMKLGKRLIDRAGYDSHTPKSVHGGSHHVEYLDVLKALAHIGGRKTDEYGDFRMVDLQFADREIWGCYWDIKRKFGRLEQQLKTIHHYVATNGVKPRHDAISDVMETLSDQAVYCVRMIQILARLEEKGMI